MSTFALEEIGRAFGIRLGKYRARNPLVLGLSPGGVPIAQAVSQLLGCEFDFFQAEGIDFGGYRGAVAESGEIVLDAGGAGSVSGQEFAGHVSRHISRMSARRTFWFRGAPLPEVTGRTVLVVTDVLASGARLRAVLANLRHHGAGFVVALAIAGTDRAAELVSPLADDILCLMTSTRLAGVGRKLRGWKRVPRQTVFRLLAGAPVPPRLQRSTKGRVSASPQHAPG